MGPFSWPAFGGIQTIRVQVHGNIAGTFFGNGVTLREIELGQIFIDLVEGAETDVGLVFRVFLSGGGAVIADVGRLGFDAEGNVISKADPTRPCMATSLPCAALS